MASLREVAVEGGRGAGSVRCAVERAGEGRAGLVGRELERRRRCVGRPCWSGRQRRLGSRRVRRGRRRWRRRGRLGGRWPRSGRLWSWRRRRGGRWRRWLAARLPAPRQSPVVAVEPIAVILAVVPAQAPLAAAQASVATGDDGVDGSGRARLGGLSRPGGSRACDRGKERESNRKRDGRRGHGKGSAHRLHSPRANDRGSSPCSIRSDRKQIRE